jgi:hypothetical protein
MSLIGTYGTYRLGEIGSAFEVKPDTGPPFTEVSVLTQSGRQVRRVERFFNRIKQCRRVATRSDKLAANCLAFIQLASIRLWVRVDESTP